MGNKYNIYDDDGKLVAKVETKSNDSYDYDDVDDKFSNGIILSIVPIGMELFGLIILCLFTVYCYVAPAYIVMFFSSIFVIAGEDYISKYSYGITISALHFAIFSGVSIYFIYSLAGGNYEVIEGVGKAFPVVCACLALFSLNTLINSIKGLIHFKKRGSIPEVEYELIVHKWRIQSVAGLLTNIVILVLAIVVMVVVI